MVLVALVALAISVKLAVAATLAFAAGLLSETTGGVAEVK
jgi:hypothetical protein